MQPNIIDHIPEGLLEKPAAALYQQLPGPTLIHLPGRNPKPLVVSVLQHGNEDTGWEAVRILLKHRYAHQSLPRSICLLIGNVAAARFRQRRLDDQPDFNRCWPHAVNKQPQSKQKPYVELFQIYADYLCKQQPFAALDIHNNTGLNPHYAAINSIDWRFIHLARAFSEQVVYFTMPHGTLAQCMSEHCPSLTLECGQAGNVHGTDHALEYIEHCLQLEHLENTPLPSEQTQLYHMLATVYVSPGLQFSFAPEKSMLSFIPNLDHLNFTEMPPGTVLAHLHGHSTRCLLALNHSGHDITDECFSFDANMVRTLRPLMPSMLTPDTRVIRQDCLCYLMERIDPNAPAASIADNEALPDPLE